MTLWTIATLYLVGSLLLISLFMAAKRGRMPSQEHFEDDEQARFLSARTWGAGHRTSSLTSTSSGTAH
jgi:hypothetical protein